MYTKEQYLEGIRLAEARKACKCNLQKAKEFFAAEDFEALHRIVVGNQEWLREQGVIKELLSGTGETWHDNGHIDSIGSYVDGEEHGYWEYFNDNGHPWMRGAYESGKRHGVWEWFHDGLIYERKTYDHGKLIKTEKF